MGFERGGAFCEGFDYFFLVLWGFLTDFQHSNPIPLTHPIRMAEGGGFGPDSATLLRTRANLKNTGLDLGLHRG